MSCRGQPKSATPPPPPSDEEVVDSRCRDCGWGVLGVAFAVGAVIIGALGFKQGRLNTLVYGVDYSGQVCRSGQVRQAAAALRE